MIRKAGKQKKLARLAILTAVTLAGIIGLQVYWLYTSYAQQLKRFRSDVASAVSEVSMYESLMNITGQGATPAGMPTIVINYTTSAPAKTSPKPYKVKITDEPDEVKHKPGFFISKPAKDPTLITRGLIDTLMDSSKVKLAEELKKREIYVPFELAIVNDKGKIVKATCDTPHFHKIPLKPAAKPLVSDGNKDQLLLQAAFPDANLYLLRRMAIILSVTSLLIIIGAWSFGYMLFQFFKQKKIADIRNDFMNNMTHELKTPISGALIAMELAEGRKHQPDEAERLKYIGLAKSEMMRLANLLDHVLKMAAFDQSEIRISKSPQLVKDLVSEAIKNLQALCEDAGAEIKVNAADDHLTIDGDKVQLVHALQNLLENAIKYNDKPTPKIGFDISAAAAGVTVTVTDNGKGIPKAYVSRVFEKFFRVPSGDIHDIKGYGLGLSYVKAIIVLHGGTINVSSQEREGSVFAIFLPFK